MASIKSHALKGAGIYVSCIRCVNHRGGLASIKVDSIRSTTITKMKGAVAVSRYADICSVIIRTICEHRLPEGPSDADYDAGQYILIT
jgi:hypothetical protein